MLDLSKFRIGVTGGHGFLGTHLCNQLRVYGCSTLLVPKRCDFDFTQQDDVRRWYREYQPEIVFHLAAEVGGIEANRKHPGRFFYVNALMGIQLMEEARKAGVRKFIQVGTICAYPKYTTIPFRETDLWNGYPEETNAPYGIAKKSLLVMTQAYRQEYKFDAIYLLPVNLYGPGDNFDLENSHVIPALIRKCVEARHRNEPSITCWGTGQTSREFLFVKDCAEGLIAAAEYYSGSEPINLGTGQEIKIKDLIDIIAKQCEFSGEIIWDTLKPDGQPRRCLDTERAKALFGFVAKTPFEAGIQETVHWYQTILKKGHPSSMIC